MNQDALMNLRVLVLDDNRNFLTIMRSILHGLGVKKVFDAKDPVDAFEILKSSMIDLAFVDYWMADLNGIEFAHLIRSGSDSPNPYLPIIMVSGDGKMSTVKRALHNGVDEFLAKPVRPIDVLNRIKAVMDRPRRYISSSDGYFGPDRRRRRDDNYHGQERRKTDQVIEMNSKKDQPDEMDSKKETIAL